MRTIIDPPIGRDGFNVVRRARLFIQQNRQAYPLSFHADIRGAEKAVAGGYLSRSPDDVHFVTVTAKGEAYLDRLMRAE